MNRKSRVTFHHLLADATDTLGKLGQAATLALKNQSLTGFFVLGGGVTIHHLSCVDSW